MAQAPAVVANDLFSTDDPVKLFELTEEIATGSYGAVYKVSGSKRCSSPLIASRAGY